MISKIKLNNFGPIVNLDWQKPSKINLILGENGSGKTFLLKALYAGIRTLEEYQRGNEHKRTAEILAEKIYWTFQSDKIGDLVTKGANSPLTCEFSVDGKTFFFQFGKDTTKKISQLENHVLQRNSVNSVFLPAKEVLSLLPIILKSREQDRVFGFDDAYLDLAKALQIPPQRGKNKKEFSDSRWTLRQLLGGRIELDKTSNKWFFKKGNQKFLLGATSEGIKKIAILDTLLSNRYLSPESVVFIDEPESALHPTAISSLLDIIVLLAKAGIQFFIASHSYFVVKKLFLLSLQKQVSISLLSHTGEHVLSPPGENEWLQSSLENGLPDNPIIQESIRLYEEEVELSMK